MLYDIFDPLTFIEYLQFGSSLNTVIVYTCSYDAICQLRFPVCQSVKKCCLQPLLQFKRFKGDKIVFAFLFDASKLNVHVKCTCTAHAPPHKLLALLFYLRN
jgi:hypothetical protein